MNWHWPSVLILVAIVAALFLIEGRGVSGDELARETYERDVQRVEESRAACESTNDGIRQPFYDFLSDAIDAREADGDTEVADDYRAIRRDQLEAIAAVAKHPGSPQVDCQTRFSLPDPPPE